MPFYFQHCRSNMLRIGASLVLICIVGVGKAAAAGLSIVSHVQESGTKVTLLDIHFQDRNRGWAVGGGWNDATNPGWWETMVFASASHQCLAHRLNLC